MRRYWRQQLRRPESQQFNSRSRRAPAMLTKRNWFLYLTFQIGALSFAASGVLAQEKPAAGPASGSAPAQQLSTAKQIATAKQKATPATSDAGEETDGGAKNEQTK